MTKLLITISIFFLSLTGFSQDKPDTVIQVTWTVQQYNAFIQAIQQNVDSKKTTADLIEFINKNARLVAVKPKDKK